VLSELYSTRSAPPNSSEPRANEAFARRYDNESKPQYYLQTIERPTTLYHIQSDGVFWNPQWDETPDPTVGETVFTNGFVWTHPSYSWAWKNEPGARTIRVRIDVPAGTQVVVDRAPVFGGKRCQFDEGRESLVPDILLGPAMFRVTAMRRYRSTESDYSDSDERFEYVEPLERGVAADDLTYARLRLGATDEFVDVFVEMMSQVRLAGTIVL
jgi:hypothetical protein